MLKVYTGNRLEKLLDIMGENIRNASNNPLAKSAVCIQTPGMQRWIGLKLADTAGISANLDFMFPGALMKRLAGVKAGETTLWPEKQELIWSVFGRLLNLPEEPVYARIKSYLEDDDTGVKTYRLAGRIADTFDQYQVYRPEMVLDWMSPASKDTPKDENDIWQKELFRSLFPDRTRCKTSVFDRFMKNCAKQKPESLSESPLHIFGVSVLPIFFIDMLKAASLHTDVFFYLLSPTRQYWGDSKTVREIRRMEKKTGRTAAELYIDEKHELLDNLGVIGRDFFDHILGSDDAFETEEIYTDAPPSSLLSTIQSEILDLDRKDISPANDGSLIINSCHNPLREMETLYDQLLELFERDNTLSPSDVLVMTTDIEKYAPYIKAVFDNPYDEKSRIPYSVADVSEKQSNRPAGVFLELTELLTGDFSLSDVFRVLSYDIAAEKFGISLQSLPTLSAVMESSGAFWAHDKEHLLREGLDITDIFTWKKGLRRTAIGLAEGSTGALYNDAAAKDIPFSLAEQLGGLMKFADTAAHFTLELHKEKSVSEWCSDLQNMAEEFLSQSYEYADDAMYLAGCIGKISEEAAGGFFNDKTGPAPVLERLKELLDESRGAKGFMSGRVTFCAMLPMRSIPFRVIAVSGLDETTFPRQKVSLEFDLMAKHPRPGDRNNRDSDRYLFLETLISAGEKLILSYTGQSEKDNSAIPPSTLITELSAHLKNRFGLDDTILRQKLHSFSREYFRNGPLFTFSPEKYRASAAFAGAKSGSVFSSEPVVNETDEVLLSDFERFFISPPEYFLKHSLGINTTVKDGSLPETEPLTFSGLNRYSLTEETLAHMLTGTDDSLEYRYKTAQLPPENLGLHHMSETRAVSSQMAQKAEEILGGRPETVETEITAGGLTIKGSIPGVSGGRHTYIRPSGIKPKDLMRAWIRHLILNRTAKTETFLVGLKETVSIAPCEEDHLTALAEIFLMGQEKPLRFHITDGIQSCADKSFRPDKDDYSSIKTDFSFYICFGGETQLDRDITEAVALPVFRYIGGGK